MQVSWLRAFGLSALAFLGACSSNHPGQALGPSLDAGPELDAADAAAGPILLLFGGIADSFNMPGDTWAWDGTQWMQRQGTGPAGRTGHAMATLGGKVILFGGADSSGAVALGDTWTWDGTAWTQLQVTAPPARTGHAMATLGTNVVLFGGQGAASLDELLADTWTWDGSRWTQLPVSGPSARSGHTMTTLNDKIVLFGGSGLGPPNSAYVELADTWTWEGKAWKQQAVGATGPVARTGHAAAALAGSVVLYGGVGNGTTIFDEDTWLWNGTAWTPAAVSGASTVDSGNPAYDENARVGPAMGTLAGGVVLFGGTYATEMRLDGGADEIGMAAAGDTWLWSGSAWTPTMQTGPSARGGAAMTPFP